MENRVGKNIWSLPDLLIFLFLPAAFLLPAGGEAVFALAAGWGTFSFAKDRLGKVHEVRNGQFANAKVIGIALATILAIKIASLTWSIDLKATIRDIGTHIHFALFLPVLYGISKSERPFEFFRLGAIVAAVGCGLWACAHIVKFNFDFSQLEFEARAQNSLVLALLANCVVAWLVIFYLQKPTPLVALAGLLAVVAVIASGRRTGVLTLAVNLTICAAQYLRNQYQTRTTIKRLNRQKFLAIVLFATLMVWIALYYFSRSAWDLGLSEYLQSVTSDAVAGSIGMRLSLYKTAIRSFIDAPLLGHGAGTTAAILREFYVPSSEVPPYTHFHNHFLQYLSDVGLIGTCGMIAGLFVAGISIMHQMNGAVLSRALPVLMFSSFLIFSLTNLAFKQGLQNSFFIFSLAIFFRFGRTYVHTVSAQRSAGEVAKDSIHHPSGTG